MKVTRTPDGYEVNIEVDDKRWRAIFTTLNVQAPPMILEIRDESLGDRALGVGEENYDELVTLACMAFHGVGLTPPDQLTEPEPPAES